ncbi:MAG: glycosyltransferase family 2 protein, partial [Candidatus Nanopelagicales bacterium]
MGPFFSIVVPAHNVRSYIDECVSSVLSQDADLELIVVDDHSTDGTAELIAQHPDARVTVVTLDRAGGPGPARNAGVACATGRYVVFLDSDDALAPGSLAAVRRRLEETGSPDLLLVDFDLWWADGATTRNPQAAILSAASLSGAFPLGQHPEILGLYNAPWTRAHRLEFIQRAGLSFPDGYYEDLPWTMCG